MLFRQLFEPESYTYTYLLGCPQTGETLLIDPVLETVERDLEALRQLDRKLSCALETHIHADHVTGACKLRALSGCRIAGPAMDELPCRDVGVREGETFRLGSLAVEPLFTPGHTATHHAYRVRGPAGDLLFTGDALLIDACGRTDFQGGDAAALYRSVHDKLFALPDDTLVYPAHDYAGRRVSTVAQEKARNPRLGGGRGAAEFVAEMNALELPYPAKMDYAVPGNERCGECLEETPAERRRLCAPHDQG